jgi:hypothetical protein
MFDDPSVRSVRVATALCDRFAELLKGPAQVSAHKQQGALFGISGNESDLSLRIGEAQQLYPEIWRHLDDARAAFAKRVGAVDAGLADYDRLRADEGQGLGAAVDVSYEVRGAGRHAVESTTKAANFNAAGLQRARDACLALVRATPQIDWAAIARAEEDPAIAAFARSAKSKRWLWFALLLGVLAAPFGIVLYLHHKDRVASDDRRAADRPEEPLDGQDRAELATTVAQTRAMLAAARKSWPTAVAADALAKIAPGTQPCAAPFAAPTPATVDRFVRDGTADPKVFAASAFRAYGADQPLRDGDLAEMAATVGAVDSRLKAGIAAPSDRAELANLAAFTTFLVIDRDVQPALTSTKPVGYVPGEVTGRAYVFSVRDARIVCAGAITARNPDPGAPGSHLDVVRSARDARDVLHRELEVAIRTALAAGLRAVP